MNRFTVVAAMLVALASPAKAQTIYTETMFGDLSNTYTSPTTLFFLPGPANTVSGTTGRSSTTGQIDFDIFTFNVPTGFVLSGIVPVSTTTPSLSFIAIDSGTSLSVDPAVVNSTFNPAGLLGYAHYGPASFPPTIGTNILAMMGTAAGADGFTPPLGAGDYTIWLQETGTTPINYTFNFEISAAIPEPETYALLAAGLLLLGYTAQRRRNSLARFAS